MERLQKIIAESGFCSRRKAEEYIKTGQVSVNGQTVNTLGVKANYDDEIIVQGKLLANKEEKEYYLLYKPNRVVTTVKDEHNRKTVVDLIPTKARIYPVGRLDYDTTGALLLTNDGVLTERLTHPRNEIEKLYSARIRGILTPEEIKKIKTNLVIEGRKVVVTYFKVKQIYESNESQVLLGIVEGRNHIVKKIFASVQHPVVRLKRESFAFLTLEGLKMGEYRSLSIKEVKRLYSLK